MLLFYLLILIGAKCHAQKFENTSCFSFNTNNFLDNVYDAISSDYDLFSSLFRWTPFANFKSIEFYYYLGDHYNMKINKENATRFLNSYETTSITFIIHGWGTDINDPWIDKMADAYIAQNKTGNAIIIVDWSELGNLNYLEGCALIYQDVGKTIAEFLLALNMENLEANLEILGHSCGAHIAAVISNELAKEHGKKITKIVALDAAHPCFAQPILRDLVCDVSLKKENAEFVQAFYTNPGYYGIGEPYGHLNVLINGPCQPKCVQSFNPIGSIKCSHFESLYVWIDTIENPEKYKDAGNVFRCDDNEKKFEHCDQEARGIQIGDKATANDAGNYFLRTTG